MHVDTFQGDRETEGRGSSGESQWEKQIKSSSVTGGNCSLGKRKKICKKKKKEEKGKETRIKT